MKVDVDPITALELYSPQINARNYDGESSDGRTFETIVIDRDVDHNTRAEVLQKMYDSDEVEVSGIFQHPNNLAVDIWVSCVAD